MVLGFTLRALCLRRTAAFIVKCFGFRLLAYDLNVLIIDTANGVAMDSFITPKIAKYRPRCTRNDNLNNFS